MKYLVIVGRKANTWAWGLEEALRLRAKKLDVTILDLGDSINSKPNPRSRFQSRILQGKGIRVISWTSLLTKEDLQKISKTVRKVVRLLGKSDDWLEFEYEKLPIGRILMSSYARTEGARNFPLINVPKTMRYSVIKQVLIAHCTFRNLDLEFDRIVFSNGRGPMDAAILTICRNQNIATSALESGAHSGKYCIFSNSPHYAPDWWEAVIKFSETANHSEILESSRKYWSKKLAGIDEWSSRDWSKEFVKGKLPKGLPKKFVTYFCTSEHEVPVFEDFEGPKFEFMNQQEAIKSLATICSEIGLHLVIKRHPNSLSKKGVDNENPLWSWAKESKKITYIDPCEKYDSYALLRRSACVLTYKSSTGIEAAALRIPSRSLGPAKWAFTEESRADSKEKILQFLKNPTPLSEDHVQNWGAFMSSFGNDLKIFSEIKGGFALADGVKYFATEYYMNSWQKFSEKLHRRLVDAPSPRRNFGE